MSERAVEWCVVHDAPWMGTTVPGVSAAPGEPFCQEAEFDVFDCRFVTATVLVPDPADPE